MPRWAKIALVALLVVPLLLVAAALLVVTQTELGHERVRRMAQDLLNDNSSGIVRIGGIGGNLLSTLVVRDLSITDSAGRPFVSVDRVTATYSLRSILRKRVDVSRLHLERPVIVLDRRPGDERWNWERIFPGDTAPRADTTSGFGDWIALRDVTIDSGRVMLRMPWSPSDSLGAAARDSVIADVLGGGTREMVVRVAGGYQQIMDFRDLDARLPRVRLADPDSSTMVFEVATMRTVAEPFRPPAAHIRDLHGTVFVDGDSLWFREARAALPGSRLTLGGTYVLEPGDLRLTLRAHPAALADLRWLYPRTPSHGTATLLFSMERSGGRLDFMARDIDARVEQATITGDLGMVMDDSVSFHDTDVRFSRLDTHLAEQLVKGLDVPRRGTAHGRVAVAGPLSALRVDADVTFDDAAGGTSHVIAAGVAGMVPGDFSARDLRVRLAPLDVELLRFAMPTLPISGTVSGTATVNGSTRTRLTATADLEHRDRGAYSHLAGGGAVSLGDRRRLEVELRATPLSLVTAGRLAPALGLRGSATGRITLAGDLSNLALRADLRMPDGGALVSRGRLDLASAEKGYDVATTLRLFDLASVAARLPRTSLSAVTLVRGRGFDPRTMRATLAADAAASVLDSVAFDSLHLRVAIANGTATVDSLLVRAPFARVRVDGTVGLVDGRGGELAYQVAIDSLAALTRWIPGADTGRVPPRPARLTRELERARADSARVAQATELQRLARGGQPPALRADTARLSIARDSLAGSIYTAGTVRGSVRRFDVRGRLALSQVVARGNSVSSARGEYAVLGGGTPQMSLALAATLDSVQAAGFALDSVNARIAYRKPGGGGEVRLVIVQDTARSYDARAEFVLRTEERLLRLTELRLRFDTTVWASTRPGGVRWGPRGIAIDTIELRNAENGRIFANGTIPVRGQGDLEVDIAGLELAHVAALIQGDLGGTGILALSARAEGTQADPRFRGALGVVQASYRGTPLPDTRSTFSYADEKLTAHAELLRPNSAPLALANAELPVNLALSGVSGNRLLDRPMRFDLQADSLPLEILPELTDAVSNIRGRLIGTLAVRGTPRRPSLAGALAVDFASFRVVPAGVTFRDIFGVIRLRGDSVVIDSLVGRSDGLVRVTGGLDIADVTQPGFGLRLTASNATVFDTDQGLLTANADIAVKGPYDAVEITGNARILHGVIYVPAPERRQVISTSDPAIFNIIDTAAVAGGEVLPSESPLLQNLRVNVALSVSRDTWVRSTEANVEIFSRNALTIEVDRRRQALTLEGVVNTERGEYTFLERRFLLSRGSVTFIGGAEINPLVQLLGQHEVRLPGQEALVIDVIVGGTLREPRVTLSSNAQPPISQTDLLSYVAFGRSSSSLLQQQGSSLSGPSAGGGPLVGDVAALVARQAAAQAIGAVTSQLEQSATREFGVDVFNVRPADVPNELSLNGVEGLLRGTEVEVGKYLNRRTFAAFQARPAGGIPGFRLQHRLPGALRIEATFEPRFLLREPSLAADRDPARPVGVLGAFLVREWRF